MKPKGSLSHSQLHATCPFPEPDQTNPRPHIPIPVDHLILFSLLLLCPQSGLLSGLPQNTVYTTLLSPIPATCSAQIITEFHTEALFPTTA
jgi:hypothetical protein